MAEPIQGVGGFVTPPPEYFQIAVGIVRKYGGLFICDEVQTGFGRTGQYWFGIEHWGVEPDIMTMAKGIANGTPMGATIATPEVADKLEGLTISTFGGNPVSCAAAGAVIDTMEGLLPHARELSGHAFERLKKLKVAHQTIGDVRGLGLMIGIELVEDPESREPDAGALEFVADYAMQHELIVINCGPDGNVIRFIPPLVTTNEELDTAIDTIDAALAEYEAR